MKELAKNAIKRIAAIGLGTVMLGATVFSAVAADLKDYPAPFVNNGVFNGEIVVGADAKTADVVGAIDIAASLQYAMKSTGTGGSTLSSTGGVVTVDTGAAGVSGGFLIQATGSTLSMGQSITSVKASVDKTDLPDLLADGKVTKDGASSGTSYTQKITFDNAAEAISFGRSADSDSFGDVPGTFLATNSGDTYALTVKFQGTIDATALTNSETITIAGKDFTFDPTQAQTGDLTLIGSQDSIILELGQTKTISGVDYTLLGANTKGGTSGTAILKVGSSQKTVSQGDSVTIGGQDVYIKSLYVTDIPTTSASIEVFVGSQKIKIPQGAANADTIQINDKSVDGVKGYYTSSGNTTDISSIVFNVTRKDIDMSGAENYMKEGQSFVDPLFGTFELSFAGQSVEDMGAAKDPVVLQRNGDYVQLSYQDENGIAEKINLYKYYSTGLIGWADKVVYNGTTIVPESDSFIVKEGTNVYEVLKLNRVYKDNEVLKADFIDSAGNTRTISNNTQLGDIAGNIVLDYTNKIATLGTNTINLGANSTNGGDVSAATSIELNDKANIVFGGNVATVTGAVGQTGTVTVKEYSNGGFSTEGLPQANITVTVVPSTNSDNRLNIAVSNANLTNGNMVSDNGGKNSYTVTQEGTYVHSDLDQDSIAEIYYPRDPVVYNVYVAPTGSASTTQTKEYKEGDMLAGIGTIKAITAGTVTGGSFNLNPISLPVAKLDTDATLGSTNQIIVGGPAVNQLAAKAIGVTYPSYGLSSGLLSGQGEAVIKLVQQGSNVAIVVAGWEAADTQRATSVLANYGNYAGKLSGQEVTITGTIASPVISLVVAQEATNTTQ